MRVLFLLGLLLMVVRTTAQTYCSDTLIVVLRSRKFVRYQNSDFPYVQNDTIYMTNKFPQTDEAYNRMLKLEDYLGEGHFCLFYDRKGRKIEECCWDKENEEGPYTSYYKNGVVKSKGMLRGSREKGTWKYYRPNGSLKEEVVHSD